MTHLPDDLIKQIYKHSYLFLFYFILLFLIHESIHQHLSSLMELSIREVSVNFFHHQQEDKEFATTEFLRGYTDKQ